MSYGALKSKIDIRDYSINNKVSLPDEFYLSNLPEVKNQYDIGACVAFVASEIAEYFERKQSKNKNKLSAGYIYGTRYSYKGKGMYPRDAIKTLKNIGTCKQSKFIYNREVPEIIEKVQKSNVTYTDTQHYRITSYFKCKTLEDIKTAIYSLGPVMLTVNWYDNNYFSKDDSYVMYPGKGKGSGHAILIYGWNKEGLLFQNSWGNDWGNKGRAILSYTYPIKEAWGVTDTYIDICRDKKVNKLPKIFYKIINFILNILFYRR